MIVYSTPKNESYLEALISYILCILYLISLINGITFKNDVNNIIFKLHDKNFLSNAIRIQLTIVL